MIDAVGGGLSSEYSETNRVKMRTAGRVRAHHTPRRALCSVQAAGSVLDCSSRSVIAATQITDA